MTLTPIKVPGKSKRHAPKSNNAGTETKRIRSGRPKDNEDAKPSHQSVVKCRGKDLKYLRPKGKISLLESLPTEVLERVFLFSMSFELPRSSPIVAGKLSSKAVYRKTVLEAFSGTWERQRSDNSPRERLERQVYLEVEKVEDIEAREHSMQADALLQNKVLSCRWSSLSIILEAQETWIVQSRYCIGKSTSVRRLEQEFSDDFESFSTGCLRNYARLLESVYEVHAISLLPIHHPHLLAQQNPLKLPSPFQQRDVESFVEIPTRLLHGPWSEAEVRLFYWLVTNGVSVDQRSSINGEIALDGLKRAITLEDCLLIYLFACLGITITHDTAIFRWTLDTTSDRRACFNFCMLVAEQQLYSPHDDRGLRFCQDIETVQAETECPNDSKLFGVWREKYEHIVVDSTFRSAMNPLQIAILE